MRVYFPPNELTRSWWSRADRFCRSWREIFAVPPGDFRTFSMSSSMLWYVSLIVGGLCLTNPLAAETVHVKKGSYIPLYGAKDGSEIHVEAFSIDKTPVTNKEFLEFVQAHPAWRRSKVKRIFAEDSYLQDWRSDLVAPPERSESPVTHVSWFAAKAYCKSKNMRLPTLNEWELVAMASKEKRDAREDPEFTKSILAGYEAPKTYLKKVMSSEANLYGVYDLHGLVWEWVSDFNSVIISGESRNDGDDGLFCAAGSVGATDLANYAAFMRYAFRASLKANYTLKNLGFRCAKGKE